MVLYVTEVGIRHTINTNISLPHFQCDAVSTLEKEHDFREEHFDFIQQYIRKFCLKCILLICSEISGVDAEYGESVWRQYFDNFEQIDRGM